jgi:hypothetical protein
MQLQCGEEQTTLREKKSLFDLEKGLVMLEALVAGIAFYMKRSLTLYNSGLCSWHEVRRGAT